MLKRAQAHCDLHRHPRTRAHDLVAGVFWARNTIPESGRGWREFIVVYANELHPKTRVRSVYLWFMRWVAWNGNKAIKRCLKIETTSLIPHPYELPCRQPQSSTLRYMQFRSSNHLTWEWHSESDLKILHSRISREMECCPRFEMNQHHQFSPPDTDPGARFSKVWWQILLRNSLKSQSSLRNSLKPQNSVVYRMQPWSG